MTHPYVQVIIETIRGTEQSEKKFSITQKMINLIQAENETGEDAKIELAEALKMAMQQILDRQSEDDTFTIMSMLVKAGANPNVTYCSPYTNNYTPLILAARGDRQELVSLLIKNGADVDAELHPCPKTALIFAISNKNVSMATALLKAGANPVQSYEYFEDGCICYSSAPELASRNKEMLNLLRHFYIKGEEGTVSSAGVFSQSKTDQLTKNFDLIAGLDTASENNCGRSR